MGIEYDKIKEADPDGHPVRSIDTGFIWVCIRIERLEGQDRSRWYIQGIAFYEHVAVEMCRDENYFIGPLPVNTALPHKPIEWVGAYFPLKP